MSGEQCLSQFFWSEESTPTDKIEADKVLACD
jgi:hypothetical protein